VLQLVLHECDISERGRSDCRVDTGFVRSGNIQYYIFCRVDTGFVRSGNIQYYIFCRVDTAQQLDVFTE